jgi:hypothetical protein
MKRLVSVIISLLVLFSSLPPRAAADIALPDFSGANPVPDSRHPGAYGGNGDLELLSAASPYAPSAPAMTRTTAVFSMQTWAARLKRCGCAFATYWGYQATHTIRAADPRPGGR